MDPLAPLEELAQGWRADAVRLRRWGAETQAAAVEEAADELEERLQEWALERLTLEEAARESGLAYDTVQRKVSSGEWPNAGKTGSPRVRRCDVLPGLEPPGPREASGPVDALAEEVLRSRNGGG